MKKVLIFSLSYFPKHVGGAEVAIQEITNRIPGIEFHMITLRYDSNLPKESKEGRVHVHRIGWTRTNVTTAETFSPFFYLAKIFFVPLAAIKAYRLHKKERFDGFWAMMVYMQLPIVLMRLCGVKVPYALTLQEGDPFKRVFSRWYIALFRPLIIYGFKNARVIQTISTFLAGWARKMGYAGSVEVIPNAVDVGHFSGEVSVSVINEIKDRLGKRMGDVFLITTSRLVHKNAVDDCIRAVKQLPQNVHFVVLGIGPEQARLKKLVSELHLESRVKFMGHVTHEEMPKYLAACDIFVRPSRSEGMGNSFIEAMAAGLPVVATQEGGVSDFLFDEKRNPDRPVTGWAVNKDSPEDIARAVNEVINSPEKVRAVIRTAREMVKEKYDWDIIAADMRERVFMKLFA